MKNTKAAGSELFFVKGLKFPLSNANRCISQIIENYYEHKENFVLFSSISEGKISSLIEILKKLQLENFVIFSNNKIQEIQTKLFNKNENYETFDYLIFYNMEIPFASINYKEKHISSFFDYNILNEDFKVYINNSVKDFPSDFIYTTICKPPRKKKVEFIFGTNNNVKALCLFDYKDLDANVFCNDINLKDKFLELKNTSLNFINQIRNERHWKMIFYDIELPDILKGIDLSDELIFIYTIDDIKVLRQIIVELEARNIDVPEQIKVFTATN